MTRNSPDKNDRNLFRKTVGKVRPVNDDRVVLPREKPSPKPRQRELDEMAVLRELGKPDSEGLLVETGEELRYLKPGVSANILKRLRRGQYSVGAELDLHQMNAEAAHKNILGFLDECQHYDISCVRIIHGKGLRSRHSGPVLKQLCSSLLRRHSEVMAFASAKANDGGTGALYVLIKRY